MRRIYSYPLLKTLESEKLKVFIQITKNTTKGMILLEKPLISVIIPVYNKENYMKKCIDSVLIKA